MTEMTIDHAMHHAIRHKISAASIVVSLCFLVLLKSLASIFIQELLTLSSHIIIPCQYHPNQAVYDPPPYSSEYSVPVISRRMNPEHPGSNTSAMSSGSNSRRCDPPYPPSYHPQESNTNRSHQQQECRNYDLYHQPAAAANAVQHTAISINTGPYSQSHPHHYYPGATPPTLSHSLAPDTLKLTPLSIAESIKHTTPSSMGRGPSIAEEVGDEMDLSPSMFKEEDERKPSACENKRKIEVSQHQQPQGCSQDFEPIPLNEIKATSGFSATTAASMQHPPPSYAVLNHGTVFSQSQSYPQASSTMPADPFAAHSRVSASTITSTASTHDVAPPTPGSTPITRRQRTVARSDSGSTTSSTGGEAGSWERRFNELIEFNRINGHCEVPQNYSENTSLGTWVNKQRMEQKNRTEGKKSSLNNSRLERLQNIGFRWAKPKGQPCWDEKYNELLAYKVKFGNCHVPTKYRHNSALGRWVSTQRAEFRKYQEGQKTWMNEDKIRKLDGIGFVWSMSL